MVSCLRTSKRHSGSGVTHLLTLSIQGPVQHGAKLSCYAALLRRFLAHDDEELRRGDEDVRELSDVHSKDESDPNAAAETEELPV